ASLDRLRPGVVVVGTRGRGGGAPLPLGRQGRNATVGRIGHQPRTAVLRLQVFPEREAVDRPRGVVGRAAVDHLAAIAADFLQFLGADVLETAAGEFGGFLERDARLVTVGVNAGQVR